MTFDVHQLDLFLLIGSTVILGAILAARLAVGAGLPSLLIFLLMGLVLGEAGPIAIHFDDAQLAHAIGFGALALILAEGGLTTEWHEMRTTLRLGIILATLGVAISVGVVAVGAHYFLGLPWELAVLLGAICSPTDAAAVFSVLRTVPLPRRLTSVLETESGLNDAPTVVLVTVISSGAFEEDGIIGVVSLILYELTIGTALGVLVGLAGAWLMRRIALPASGLYPLAVLALAFVAYGTAAAVHASGFAAIYVAALVLGNSELPHRGASRSFAEGLAWLAQIGLFVMLGLLMPLDRIQSIDITYAIVTGLMLTVVARPLSVWISSFVQPMPLRELAFISWAGLRGAVPIVLATIPLAAGVNDALRIFDLVFVMVVVYTLLTGPTLPWVARMLGVARPAEPRHLDVEAAPLEKIAADLLQVSIVEGSKMHGVEVGELRLPTGASVSLVIRGDEVLVPSRRTVLRSGDDLVVVTPRRMRDATESRLRRVSKHGRLAHWLTEAPSK